MNPLGSSCGIDNEFRGSPNKKEQRFMNFDEKRVICDGDGCPLFVIKEPLMQVDDKQYVYATDSDGKPAQELFRIGSNFGNTSQYTENLKNAKGEAIQLKGKMTLVSMKGGIWLGDVKTGQPIAKVCSPVTYKDPLLKSNGTYSTRTT